MCVVKRIKECHIVCGYRKRCQDFTFECPILAQEPAGFRRIGEDSIVYYDYEVSEQEKNDELKAKGLIHDETGTISPGVMEVQEGEEIPESKPAKKKKVKE
jgi:hypothetical protein